MVYMGDVGFFLWSGRFGPCNHSELAHLARPFCAIAAAALSGYSVAMQNQKFAVDSADLHARWNRLAKEFESIWENVYADDASEHLNALDDRAIDLSKAAASGIKYDERRLLRWEEHVVQNRLAHGNGA